MSEIIRTREEFERDLLNNSFAVYVYIGPGTDKGWQVAEITEGLIPRLRVYRTEDVGMLNGWLKDSSRRGILFGVDDQPKKELTLAEAEDLMVVMESIKAAW